MPLDRSFEQQSADVHGAWRGYFGPLLSKHEAQRRLGGLSEAKFDHLVAGHQLLALPTERGELAFQFTQDCGLSPVVAAILAILGPVVATPYTTAVWFITPQPVLNGETPAQWLRQARSPQRLKEAARGSAARLGQ